MTIRDFINIASDFVSKIENSILDLKFTTIGYGCAFVLFYCFIMYVYKTLKK